MEEPIVEKKQYGKIYKEENWNFFFHLFLSATLKYENQSGIFKQPSTYGFLLVLCKSPPNPGGPPSQSLIRIKEWN